jgi:hypothetical protein
MPIKNFVVYFLLIVAYLAGFCGFHGHNGLDPESLLHIFNTYITPVLLYGMELLLPFSKPLEQLELFQKMLTHINQLDSSFTVSCLLASFFSVFFSH